MQAQTTHVYALLIHKQTYVNTYPECTQAHRLCQLDLPLFLFSSRLWSSTFFFHTILFQLKSPEPPIYHTVSQRVHIQTSVLHIFHTLHCNASAAKPQTISNYITHYECMFSSHFHTISKMS